MERQTDSAALLQDMSRSSSLLKLLHARNTSSANVAQGAAINGSLRSSARTEKRSRSNTRKESKANRRGDDTTGSKQLLFGRNDVVLAADRGDLQFFRDALQQGASGILEVKECRGMGFSHPLHFAARQGHAELVNFLLWSPALRIDANIRDKNLDTPLHFAALSGKVGVWLLY